MIAAVTGAFVGATDLAVLYPLLTVATRRETGVSGVERSGVELLRRARLSLSASLSPKLSPPR